MANFLTRRLSFWHDAFRSKVRAGMGLFITVFTILMIFRDAILDPKHKDWFLFKYAPDWSWQTWLVIGLCAFLLLTLESGFSKNRADKRAFVTKHKVRLSALKTTHLQELANARLETLITGKEAKKTEVTVTDAERELFASISGQPINRDEETAAVTGKTILECVHKEVIKVRMDNTNRITKDERGHNLAALAYFHLKPAPDSEPWVSVRAIITLLDIDSNQKERGKDGVWFPNKNDKEAVFRLGDTHPLVIAVYGNKVGTYEFLLNQGRRPMFTPFVAPQIEVLEGKNFRVSVQMIARSGSELVLDETFEFNLVAEPEFAIKPIESGQAPTARVNDKARHEYKIKQLQKLIDDYHQLSMSDNDDVLDFIGRQRGWQMRAERFLKQYFDEPCVQRFKEKGVIALEELLAEILS